MGNIYSSNKDILNEMKRMLTEEDKIRYKDDGESKEMPADSAKKLPNDHPAKKAWLAKQKGDSDDSGEKVKGADLFKSKEGEPKAKSSDKETKVDPEQAYDAADEAVEDILGDLGGAPVSKLVDRNAAALKSYFNSDVSDDEKNTFIEDRIVDTGVSIDAYQVAVINKVFKNLGIDHTINYDSIEKRKDNDSPPQSPFFKKDSDSDSDSDTKDTPELPEKAVDDMLNNTPDKNAEFSEKYGIDVKEFKSMDEGGWGYLEDELAEKGVEANSSFNINTDNEHGDPISVHVYNDFAVYVDSYTGNFDITSKQDLAAGLKDLSGKKESVRESFLSKTAKRVLSRRIK
tara:strand:+ start:595 stop:1626 length:1032 start_codon:yes stop_codon:yes gene_type:complete